MKTRQPPQPSTNSIPRSGARAVCAVLVIATACTLLVGCRSVATPAAETVAPSRESVAPAAPPAAPAAEPELPLRDFEKRLAAAIDGYTRALEAFTHGDQPVTGLADDLAALDRVAAECGQIAGCSTATVAAAYSRVVRLHTAAIATERRQREEEIAAQAPPAGREPGTTSFTGAMPTLDRSVSLIQGADFRNLIELNGPVNAALDDWLTWLRPAFLESYRNYLYLRPLIAPIYDAADLPEALLFAMIATETRGKVHSTSSAGASGLLQFMPATGRLYGLREVDGFDQRFDPEAATRANVAYLNYHFGQFNNSLEKVLAAYNGGEGRMRGLHRRYSGSSFWDERVYYSLPRETRDYVPRILAAAWLFLHPDDYGLELPAIDPARARMTVASPIALDELAICLGQAGNPDGWFRTLRNLNPRLEPGERVAAGDAIEVPAELVPRYEARCLGGELLARARTLHDANYPPEPRTIPYTVRRGDTLSRIAGRIGCADIRTIARMNRISAPGYAIREGQLLRVPACG